MMNGDNLHEMSNPVFLKTIKKYFRMLSAAKFTKSAKYYVRTEFKLTSSCIFSNSETLSLIRQYLKDKAIYIAK